MVCSPAMRICAVLALLAFGLAAPAAASDYRYERRPEVHFPGSGAVHVSPYPAGKRAASVWVSDACWFDCTRQSGWRHDRCLRVEHPELCRSRMDADDRICLRACRTKGGPLLNITD